MHLKISKFQCVILLVDHSPQSEVDDIVTGKNMIPYILHFWKHDSV